MGGWKSLLCLPQRKQAIRVHYLHERSDLPSRGSDHAREEKAGEVIGHHNAGARCQSGEQSFAYIRCELQVRIVENVRALEPAGIFRYSINHETVHPIARPRIAAAQCFEDNQWLLQLLGPLHRSVQCKIPDRPAGANHPIEDKILALQDWQGVGGPDANFGNWAQCAVPIVVADIIRRSTAISLVLSYYLSLVLQRSS